MNKTTFWGSIVALLATSISSADVNYRVTAEPAAKAIRVRVTVTDPKSAEEFRIPAWTPGYYKILDYQNSISEVRASLATGGNLSVKKVDPRCWRVENPEKQPFTFTYKVAGTDAGLGFFGVHVRESSAFINGAAGFMFSPSRMTEKHSAQFVIPGTWDVATGLDLGDPKTKTFVAKSGYDEFIDNPVQMGRFVKRAFDVKGIPFSVVWVCDAPIRANLDDETKRLQMASLPALEMFGRAPFKHFTYLVHLEVGNFAGGLEHRTSTVLAAFNAESLQLDDLATHEYFHAWNVKQMRPVMLGPFDYTKPVRTGNLWFAEGVTDYYAKLHAYQAGLRAESWLLEALGNEIENLQTGQTRKTKTVEDSSRQCWEDSGFGLGDLSFYTKGQLIGLLFDAHIRTKTKGVKSLDHVMRYMFDKYELPKPGYPEDGILQSINHVLGSDVNDLYKSMVQSTDELPYDLLKGIGLRAVLAGQTYVDPLYQTDRDSKVIFIAPNIRDKGLKIGDVILSAAQEGDLNMKLKVLRNEATSEVVVPGRRYKAVDFRLQRDPFATPETKARYLEWARRKEPVNPEPSGDGG